jgi:hypothetical protein
VTSRFTLSVLLVMAFVAGMVVMAAPAPAADLSGRRFQTPSGNIHCRQSGSTLRCDILSGLKPEPKKKCDLDWTGLTLGREGRAKPQCAGDTVADNNAPVLEYGQHWQRNGRRCVSRESGLFCRNFGGWHFKLSRDSWDRWYTP